MNWFDIIFPLAMILFPALFMTLTRTNRRADIDPALARRLLMWLWLATLGAVGLWGVAYVAFSPRVAVFAWPLFFPLFFGFYQPLMRAKNPDWVSMPPPDLPARSASLRPRQAQPVVAAGAGWMLFGAWAAFFSAVLLVVDWQVLFAAGEDVKWRTNTGWIALLIAGGQVFIAPLTIWCVRLDRREPQPLDEDASAELVELYARRRRQRAWGFIGLGLAMIMVQGAVAVSLALASRGLWSEQQMGLVLGTGGGILGSVIGIAGAVFGTMSSIHASRINRRLRELTQASG